MGDIRTPALSYGSAMARAYSSSRDFHLGGDIRSSRSFSCSACSSSVRTRAIDQRGLASLHDGLRDRRPTSSRGISIVIAVVMKP